MADGSINFDTKIDSKGLEEGLKESKKNAQKQISQIEKEINNSSKAIDNMKTKYEDVNRKLEETRSKIDAIVDSEIMAQKQYVGVGSVNADNVIDTNLSNNTDYQKLIEQERQLEQEAKEYNNEIKKAEALNSGLKNSLSSANQELGSINQQITTEEQKMQQVKEATRQFDDELSKVDYLSGIQSFEQYKQEVTDVSNRMRTIENVAQQIANTNISNGMSSAKAEELKQNLLSANSEYQKLTSKAEALNSVQSKYNTNLNKAKSFVLNLASGFKKVTSNTNQSKKSSDDFGKSIQSGIKKIAKMGLSVLSIRSAYNLLTQCSQEWLNSQNSSAKQITADLSYMKYVIGSTLQPALEGLVNILYKILGLVGSVIQSLFKVNIFANASSKAYANMANSASDTAESTSNLASFDKLNVLSDNSGSSGTATPSVDLSQIDTSLSWISDEIKDIFSQIFEPFKLAWETTGMTVIDSMHNAFNGLSDLGKSVGSSIFEVWTNGTGQTSIETILSLLSDIFNIIGNIGDAFSLAWENAETGTEIIQSIWNIFNDILMFVESIGDSLSTWTASESFQTAVSSVLSFIKDILSYLEQIANWILEMYETYIAPVVDKILLFITDIINDISEIWEVWKPIVDNIIENVENTLEPVIQAFSGTLEYIITVLKGIIDFVTGIFTGDFEKSINAISDIIVGFEDFFHNTIESIGNFFVSIFENAINSIKNFFKILKDWIINALDSIKNFLSEHFGAIGTSIADSISSTIKSVVNGLLELVEGKVNSFIGMVNGAVDIINAIPGVSISYISEIQLPRLAQGAVVNNPGRGVPVIAGEAGAEAILPLDQNTEWMDTLTNKIVEKMTLIIEKALREMTINLNFDGTMAQFVRILYKELEKENKRVGTKISTKIT